MISLSKLDFLKSATYPAGFIADAGDHGGCTGIWYMLFEASNNPILAKRKPNFTLHGCRSVFSAAIKRMEVPGFGRENVPQGSMSWL
jgi:hypothetical protein